MNSTHIPNNNNNFRIHSIAFLIYHLVQTIKLIGKTIKGT